VAGDHFARRLKEKGLSEAEIASASDELRRLTAQIDTTADPADFYRQCSAFVAGFGLTLDDVAYGRGAVQFEEFQRAYDALDRVLAPFGERNAGSAPAYHIVDDDFGTRELLVEILDSGMDWEGAKRAIAMSFSESFPLWSVIVRVSGALDERIGSAE
jgi:hypothetical protein